MTPTTDTAYLAAEKQLLEKIHQARGRLARRAVMVAHYYQREPIVAMADFKGDSFELAKRVASIKDAELIIFCGVLFMAQSAAVLVGEHQKVFLPDLSAGCPLADMAHSDEVQFAWDSLRGLMPRATIVPITYVNSDISLKAFTGEHQGSVCTSANAKTIFEWAFQQGEKILFFPDENLGRNTARLMGMMPDEVVTWQSGQPLGGLSPEAIDAARVIVWNGYCHVHTRFSADHIARARKVFPQGKILVHPECNEAVVAAADVCGSTSFMARYVDEAPSGATLIIGTEINFVHRLAQLYPKKCIVELASSLCPNMYKIGLDDVLFTLEHQSSSHQITVDKNIADPARRALQRMIDITTA